MPFIQTNGISVHYEVHGQGEPVALIAGLGTDMASHVEIISLLSKKYKVLAFDNRGDGLTDKPRIRYTIEMMADDTAGLLEALQFGKTNVIGISMGGRIAMALALQHPEFVRSLILTSTFAHKTRNARLPLRYRLAKMTGLGKPAKSSQPYHAFSRQLNAARNYDCSDKLNMIEVPTLIIHGRKDRAVPFEMGEALHSSIKGSRMKAFDGGHKFCYWESGIFANAIDEFLSEIE